MGAQYSVNWEGPVSSAAATISAGYCVCPTSSGFVVATTANRTTYGRPSGIAMTAGTTAIPIQIVHAGPLTATQTGLGTGAASPIRVSSTGTLERVTTPSSSDEVVGYCFTDGSAHVSFGVLSHRVYVDSGGGGGGSPAGSSGDIQINSSGSFGSLTPGSGVSTWLATPSSANLAAAVTGETGSGALVFGTGPTLSAPVFSTISNTGTITLPTATTTLVGRDTTDTLTNKSIDLGSNTLTFTSAQLATACSNETGSGSLVFGTGPTLSAPVFSTISNTGTLTLPTATTTLVGRDTTDTLTNKTIAGASNTLSVRIANDVTGLGTGVATFLATPSGANLASALTTALPDSKGGTGLTALGAGVATWLGTPSSANLASALTGETGSGGVVFDTSPTISAPTLSSTPVLSGASCSTSNNAKGTEVNVNPVNVQTTDATVTTLDSFTIASNSAVTVSWLVTAIKSDSSEAASYSVSACFRNNAGTAAQVGTTTTTVIAESDAAWNATADNSTTTIRLRVTGKAATTIQWTAILTRLTVVP